MQFVTFVPLIFFQSAPDLSHPPTITAPMTRGAFFIRVRSTTPVPRRPSSRRPKMPDFF